MNERNICVSSRKFCTKDNNKTAHWVGRATLKTLGTDGFSKRKELLMTYKIFQLELNLNIQLQGNKFQI